MSRCTKARPSCATSRRWPEPMRNLFNLDVLAQQAPQLPAQPQVGDAPIPGQLVPATGTGTPAAPVAFSRGQPVGFFTDTTVCIGCKSCEGPCKEWTQLPAELDPQHFRLSGDSYDNTLELSGTTFRHVKFIEQFSLTDPNRGAGRRPVADAVRRVQALRASGLFRGVPDRCDHSHRVRHGLHPAGRLQWLSLL